MLPENINVPAAMARLGNASLPRPLENLGWREMAKRETPLKMRYCEAVDQDWTEKGERSGYRDFRACEPKASGDCRRHNRSAEVSVTWTPCQGSSRSVLTASDDTRSS